MSARGQRAIHAALGPTVQQWAVHGDGAGIYKVWQSSMMTTAAAATHDPEPAFKTHLGHASRAINRTCMHHLSGHAWGVLCYATVCSAAACLA